MVIESLFKRSPNTETNASQAAHSSDLSNSTDCIIFTWSILCFPSTIEKILLNITNIFKIKSICIGYHLHLSHTIIVMHAMVGLVPI